jgi:Na+/H+-dicarboxylate symporter
MARLCAAWAAALLVWLAGFAVAARLMPPIAPGDHISDFDKTVRLHVPWVVISTLMALVAGLLYADRSRPIRRWSAILLVPGLATLGGFAAGLAGRTAGPGALLYLFEGMVGVLIGTVLANLLSPEETTTSGYF